MERIWLGDNYSNFHDSFIAKHADNVHELSGMMLTMRDAEGMQSFNDLHAADRLQRGVNKAEAIKGQARS